MRSKHVFLGGTKLKHLDDRSSDLIARLANECNVSIGLHVQKAVPSTSPLFEGGRQLHVQRRPGLLRAGAAWAACHTARSTNFAKSLLLRIAVARTTRSESALSGLSARPLTITAQNEPTQRMTNMSASRLVAMVNVELSPWVGVADFNIFRANNKLTRPSYKSPSLEQKANCRTETSVIALACLGDPCAPGKL